MDTYRIIEEQSGELLAHGGNVEWTFEQAQDVAYRLIEEEFDQALEGERKEYLARRMSKLVGDAPRCVVAGALTNFGYDLQEKGVDYD